MDHTYPSSSEMHFEALGPLASRLRFLAFNWIGTPTEVAAGTLVYKVVSLLDAVRWAYAVGQLRTHYDGIVSERHS